MIILPINKIIIKEIEDSSINNIKPATNKTTTKQEESIEKRNIKQTVNKVINNEKFNN